MIKGAQFSFILIHRMVVIYAPDVTIPWKTSVCRKIFWAIDDWRL